MLRRNKLGWLTFIGSTVAGFGIGAVAGIALSGWFGRVTGDRLEREFKGLRQPRIPRSGTSTTVREARKALEESELRDLGLSIVGVSPGVVELHGWVTTRAIRARAGRILRAAPGIETVHIRVLVRGEDDGLPGPGGDAVDQPA